MTASPSMEDASPASLTLPRNLAGQTSGDLSQICGYGVSSESLYYASQTWHAAIDLLVCPFPFHWYWCCYDWQRFATSLQLLWHLSTRKSSLSNPRLHHLRVSLPPSRQSATWSETDCFANYAGLRSLTLISGAEKLTFCSTWQRDCHHCCLHSRLGQLQSHPMTGCVSQLHSSCRFQ